MINVDPQLFKLKDPRVLSLLNSKLSVQGLIHTIVPGDFIIFINNTLYALSEQQYYASTLINTPDFIEQQNFHNLLNSQLTGLTQKDKKQLARIKNDKISCRTCKYNTYKYKVLNIISKYTDIYDRYVTKSKRQIKSYPEVTQKIHSKVSKLFKHFFKLSTYERKSCLDCVTKHVCMAYIKGNQSEQGYPQHLALCLANLQEAYQETPNDCTELKELLMFCIAKSKKQNKAFVPWRNILYIINLSRSLTFDRDANDSNQIDSSFQLQLNFDTKQQLYNIPIKQKAQLIRTIDKIIQLQYKLNGQNLISSYIGSLGILADDILPYSKCASNVLRNRRIMFKAAPELVRDTEYDCKDFREALINKPNQQQSIDQSDRPCSQRPE